MNNPFQEQLLKAGVVSEQQVKKINQEKQKKRKQQRHKKVVAADQTPTKAQQAAARKAERDRELNQRKEEQARKKAISVEIDQLITNNLVKRDAKCEIVYNFQHRNKVHRLYVNNDMKQDLIKGKLGIARIEGRYELIPFSVARKIAERNEKRVILFESEETNGDENNEYANYQIPDDLTW